MWLQYFAKRKYTTINENALVAIRHLKQLIERIIEELSRFGSTDIANNLITDTAGKTLYASQNKALNDHIVTFNGITGIDCNEITAN